MIPHAPRIWNKRTDRGVIPADAVLVDRTTCWGNPFRLEDGYTREAAVEKFRQWVWLPQQRHLRNRARRRMRGKDLICWCSPLLCHAHVWLAIVTTEREAA